MQEKDSLQDLYEQAMQHDWRQAESPSHAAFARALLERAAAGQHTKALRELSEVMFAGVGGPREPERALALKWAAFKRGDTEALDELSALLGSYSEEMIKALDRERAKVAAEKAEQAYVLISWIESYLNDTTQFAHLSVGQA
jgi:hypothetical protein